MLAEHIAAVKLLLPPVPVLYDGQVPEKPAYPYNVLWSTAGTRPSVSISAESAQFEASLYLTTAGMTADAVRIVQGKNEEALLGVRPVVAGRNCWKLSVLYSEPIRQDADVTIPELDLHPMYGVVVWRLASVPA